jgi:hypothetical protein
MTVKDFLSGANIYSQALDALQMCHRAARIGSDFLVQGRLPQGKTRDNYFDYVLAEMYNSLEIQNANNPYRVRPPEGWFFKGWMAFYLFGPMAVPHLQFRLLGKNCSVTTIGSKRGISFSGTFILSVTTSVIDRRGTVFAPQRDGH